MQSNMSASLINFHDDVGDIGHAVITLAGAECNN